ncbi:hypothetical protein [Methylocella silvestris]|uniref:Uncharacterized protein n=1 Tax=Methylocella silvestris TaxID=199596 RepID=A0A2J7TFG0_METSI|nr:hypothetical protein [Methylocella silvestris]PNG25505.1 hypothetical protein CR492_13390 [Methylocella silvestris]
MSALRMFIPITKVDAAQRLVYGLATAEAEDRAGEICDYASTEPFYEKWSAAIAAATGGKSLGNLRAMHGPVAAGKVMQINFNDEEKQIEICAKVIDDAEWNKVAEGVYTGFSQGGAYAQRWTDDQGLTRYAADPNEISLVDLPCLPQACFEMIKLDGSRELRRFGKAADAASQAQGLLDELQALDGNAGASAEHEAGAPTLADQLRDILMRTAALLREAAQESLAQDTSASKAASQAKSVFANEFAPAAAKRAQDVETDRSSRQSGRTAGAVGGDFATQDSVSASLEKRFDAFASTLADVLKRVQQIEAQPLPPPFYGPMRAVAKSEDGRGDEVEKLLTDPETLSILAIKLAQRNARSPLR